MAIYVHARELLSSFLVSTIYEHASYLSVLDCYRYVDGIGLWSGRWSTPISVAVFDESMFFSAHVARTSEADKSAHGRIHESSRQ